MHFIYLIKYSIAFVRGHEIFYVGELVIDEIKKNGSAQ